MSIDNGKHSNREVVPDTHTFHLPVDECAMTLEDVAVILSLPTNDLQVIEIAPKKTDYRGSFIRLTWLRNLKDHLDLIDENCIQRYVKYHIMLLF
ncbi:hypothetical protein Ahy_B10g101954 [Arachis hypogaea]|uniref:Aminotransferase-like plant mobile domain-containing protein n=1 Tax=Arachis hypogaea TaxID=3818 RepID=A0A444X0R1_ARAHY|nr:hypothetical protein Ahy_B10g101954 [Arachis hypogaea]